MTTHASKLTKKSSARSKAPLRWIVIGVVAAGLVLVFMALAQTPTTGHAFTAFTTKGDQVSLADYRGKVVMLNFWATWCPPCRAEMPVIEAAYEYYGDRGFVVLAVNNAERADQVSNFASEYQLTFPVLLDYTADIQDQFAIKGYPTSLFLNPDGLVYATHQGMLTAAQLQTYIETGLQDAA